jgi:large conductance mechanosensitive channel
MFQEFKKFVLRGNVVDLAVGVVMGAAFASVVSAFTAAFITPLITLLGGSGSFSDRVLNIGHKTVVNPKTHLAEILPRASFQYGSFIQSMISFVITAAVIFFFVVKPINALLQKARREEPADPTTKKCPECLSEIPIDARRCAFCTTELKAA